MVKIIILAGGKSSRFGNIKCIQKIKNECIINNIIRNFLKHFNKRDIFVTVNENNLKKLKKNILYNINIVESKIQEGNFKAIQEIYSNIKFKQNEKIIIVWSDIYIFNEKLFDDFFKNIKFNSLKKGLEIPVMFEYNPPFIIDIDKYSFYNNSIIQSKSSGYHDQGMFVFDKNFLESIIKNNKLGNILDIINLPKYKNKISFNKLEHNITYSFNTIDEYVGIKKIIEHRPVMSYFSGVDRTGKSSLFEKIRKFDNFKHCFFDRGPFDSYIYNIIYNRNISTTPYINFLINNDAVIFFIRAEPSVIKRRCIDTNEKDINISQISHHLNVYDENIVKLKKQLNIIIINNSYDFDKSCALMNYLFEEYLKRVK